MNHPLSYSRYCRLTFFIYGEIGSHSLVPNLALCNPSDLGYPNKDKIFPQKPLSSLFLSRTCHPSPKGTLYHYPFEGDTKSVVIYNTDGSLSESFTYGEDYGRLLSSTKRIPDKTFTNSYTYDWYGRPWTRTYPSGFKITYSYTQNGDLEKIYGDGQTIWECDDVNVLGQITDYSQGSYSTTVDYDEFGKLEEVTTGSVFNMLYSFDDAGNLESREDYLTSQKEEFSYDDLNRLTGIDYFLNSSHTTAGDLDLTYDNGGNITSKSDLSTDINYGEIGHGYAGPHALTSIDDPVSAYKPPPQVINYTCFNKVSTIQDTIGQDTTLTLAFTYGLNNQRVKTVLSRNTTVERIKYFDGDYEEDSTSTGTKKYHYINSPTGLIGIFVKEGSADTLYHVLSDHLGSLNGVINADTDSVTYYSFNAWGIPRDPDDWTSEFDGELFAGRGFTGHEHLLEFNLINMNGRVYDPVLGRFLSPDPYVQFPDFANGYNRYAYALNNPFIYTDPTGEFLWFPIIALAVIYGGWNVGIHAQKGDIENGWDAAKYFLAGAAAGAVAGATWSVGLAGIAASSTLAQVGGGILLAGKAINGISTAASIIKDSDNGIDIMMGRAYTDENRDFLGQVLQGVSRYSWEGLQNWLGYNVSQTLNASGITDEVEYWGGVTFSTTGDQRIAVSIGSYINVRTQTYTDFNSYILTDQTVMHEYGHTFDSHLWGPLYLFSIGLPSIISANNSYPVFVNGIWTTKHRTRWYERSASRKAKEYFKKYGVVWNDYRNPTY